MDNRAEVQEFLRTRRARLTPQRAGILGGGRRRVAGLRSEEVALLAGVSADYYAKMERGTLAGGVGQRGTPEAPRQPGCDADDVDLRVTPACGPRR